MLLENYVTAVQLIHTDEREEKVYKTYLDENSWMWEYSEDYYSYEYEDKNY